MYQTARSQRNFWGTERREIQKRNRAKNIKKYVSQDKFGFKNLFRL